MRQRTFFGKLTTRPSIFLVLAGLLIAVAAAPLTAGAQNRPDHAGTSPVDELRDSLSVDLVDAPVSESDRGPGVFNGTFNITGFNTDDGELLAVGNIVGTFTPDEGDPADVDETVEVPVSTDNGNDLGIQQNDEDVCDILFLQLDGLELDLLGLVIEIPEPVIVDIYAERGPGNLLGNLLCEVVGLLDDPASGNDGALDNLLNRINNLLNALLG